MAEDNSSQSFDEREEAESVPIIAIGASAGGLLALQQFFRACPFKSGAAFVVVQHLSPTHESLMEELLTRENVMPVKMLQTSTEVEANHIYLIPPGSVMRLEGDYLVLSPREAGMFLPIDLFFESLAAERGGSAVVVVLSGTGSDGTKGAEAVNAANGFVLVQDPVDATFDGMPISVVRSGIADFCLPASELAAKALDMVGCTVSPMGLKTGQDARDDLLLTPKSEMEVLFAILKVASKIDFSNYKNKTIDRRIHRRMQGYDLESLAEYLVFLADNPSEAQELVSDLLIGVTSFFRDETAFHALAKTVIPSIIDDLTGKEEARIWVAGCSTGQEAYSLAILFLEAFRERNLEPRFRIFATDVNQASVLVASAGIYGIDQIEGISAERLERFFFKDGEFYKVIPELRGKLVFARHDLLRDPPFTRVTLTSSRNTLIYLKPLAQERALNMLRLSVKKGGYVFLGRSETLHGDRFEFEVVDSDSKIFRRTGPVRGEMSTFFGAEVSPLHMFAMPAISPKVVKPPVDLPVSVSRYQSEAANQTPAYLTLLDHWTPPSLLVDAERRVREFHGDISRFLQTRTGSAIPTMSSILPESLCTIGEHLLDDVIASNAVRVSEPLDYETSDSIFRLRISALPVIENGATQLVYLCFEPISDRSTAKGEIIRIDAQKLARTRIDQLERVLRENKINLQNAIEELETSNEELQSTNEELMASNEELQSTNEELQSVNEEINTVNAEYHEKMIELGRLSVEMDSVLKGAGVSTIFLDEAQLVRRFSAGARAYFRLRDSDIGRPLSELSHSLKYTSLQEDVINASLSREVVEREVFTQSEECIRLRIVPYIVREDQPPWAVVTITDITAHLTSERLRNVIDALPANIAVIDFDGTIVLTNAAWIRFAKTNGDINLEQSGVGCNYLSVCGRPSETPENQADAIAAHDGIIGVLQGSSTSFVMKYPCHGPAGERWFQMTVAPVYGKEIGAVISHLELTE